MIIKHLYHNDTHVANAYLHKRKATVDIKWLDGLNGADTSIELHEYEKYRQRMNVKTEDELDVGENQLGIFDYT